MAALRGDDYPKAGQTPELEAYPTTVKGKDGTLDHRGAKPKPAPPVAAPAAPAQSQKVTKWRQDMGMPAGSANAAPANGQAQTTSSHHGPRTPEDKAAYQRQLAEYFNQKPYEAPIKLPKLTTRDMINFDDSILVKVMDFEDNLARAGHTEKADAARQAFDKTLRKTLTDYRKAIIGFKDTLDETNDKSEQGKSAGRDVDSAIALIGAALTSLDGMKFAIAIGQFKAAHGCLRSAQEWAAIAFEARDSSLERAIKVLQQTRAACEMLLVVLGAGLEADAFKLAMAAVPALARGAEKLSNQWNGMDDKTSWTEVLAKGLIDVGFAALANFFDKRYFEGIKFGEKFHIKDPNTLLFIGKNTYSIIMGIAKECWQRASSGAIGNYYNQPPEALKEGVVDAMFKEYSLDSGGTIFFEAMAKLGQVMPK